MSPSPAPPAPSSAAVLPLLPWALTLSLAELLLCGGFGLGAAGSAQLLL